MSNFAFFKPEFFWALFFIILVVIIHLFKRPRLVHLDFSTIRFLQSEALSSSNKRKIRKLLQFLTRILTVLTIVILFARPHSSDDVISAFSDPQVSVYVWIDHTFSMTYSIDGKTTAQRCLDVVDSISKLVPATAKIFLFDHKTGEYILCDSQNKNNSNSNGINDFSQAVKEFKKNGVSNSILLICSDFQKGSSNIIDSVLGSSDLSNSILLVSFVPKKPWNYSINNASYSNGAVQTGIQAQGKDLESGKLILKINHNTYNENSVKVKNETISTVFLETGNQKISTGQVVLTTQDPLQFDNTLYFTSQNSPQKILIIGNKEHNYVIRAALKAVSAENQYIVTSKQTSEITYDDLDSSNVIVINSLDGPSTILDAFLMSNSNRSSSIIFCIDPDELNKSKYHTMITNVFVKQSAGFIQKADQHVFPLLNDTVSKLWRNFPSVKIDEVRVLIYGKGLPGEPVLKFNNGDTFISYLKDQANRNWIIFSTPQGITTANNIFKTAFFVPLFDRTVQFLESKNQVIADDIWTTGQKNKNPFYNSRYAVRLFDHADNYINDIGRLNHWMFEKSGLYKIVSQGKPPYYLIVRPDPAESIMDFNLPKILKEHNHAIEEVKSTEIITNIKKQVNGFSGMLLWILLAILMIIEVVLWGAIPKKAA